MEKNSYIQRLYDKGTAAYWAIADYSQEQIDAMLERMAAIVYDHADELGNMVFEETQLGDRSAHIRLMHVFPVAFWSYLKGKNAFGLLKDDPQRGIQTYGKAMGVVGCLTPSTTNISNAFENTMKAVKSGNAIVLAPHPRAWRSHKRMVELMQEGIKAVGGPDNLVQSIEDPTIEMSGELMATCDVVVGTGGAEMVKAAYSSGTPAFGVGQGCVPVIISPTYPADEIDGITATNLADRANNNGMPCTCPQMIYIPRSRKEEILASYVKNGAFLVEDADAIQGIRDLVFPNGGRSINRAVVGQPAAKIAQMYGIGEIPEGTKVLMLPVADGAYGGMDVLCQEIMNPTLRFQVYDDYAQAVELARKGLFYEGAGHSAQIFSYEQAEIDLFARRIPVVRVLVRQGSAGVPNLTLSNGLAPSTSVGCGTWGGNSFSDNLDFTTLQNHTMVIYPLDAKGLPTAKELFGDLVE